MYRFTAALNGKQVFRHKPLYQGFLKGSDDQQGIFHPVPVARPRKGGAPVAQLPLKFLQRPLRRFL
jgi:hypothetical protein